MTACPTKKESMLALWLWQPCTVFFAVLVVWGVWEIAGWFGWLLAGQPFRGTVGIGY